MRKSEDPIIILLGGASGVGKTTLANTLVHEFGLQHHVSTGFVRETVRALLPESLVGALNGHAFDAWKLIDTDPNLPTHPAFQGTKVQAQLLRPAFEACISRALREGISLVLEGSHLIPGLLEDSHDKISLACIVDVPDRNLMLQRAAGDSHRRRILNTEQLNSILGLQAECLKLAAHHSLPIVDNTNLRTAVMEIRKLIR
jgi:2-phosphoglycerate kinase